MAKSNNVYNLFFLKSAQYKKQTNYILTEFIKLWNWTFLKMLIITPLKGQISKIKMYWFLNICLDFKFDNSFVGVEVGLLTARLKAICVWH